MLKIIYSTKFKKDLKDIQNGNRYNIDELKYVINELANERTLAPKYHDHALIGNYKGQRECHIRPDWLLIYIIEKDTLTLTLSRTGNHSSLF